MSCSFARKDQKKCLALLGRVFCFVFLDSSDDDDEEEGDDDFILV